MDQVVRLASPAEKFLKAYKRYGYRYSFIERLYAYTVPEAQRVMHIGCADGFILRAMKASFAIGIDDSSFENIFTCPNSQFYPSLESITESHVFDYIVISSTYLKQAADIYPFFRSLQKWAHAGTRIIVEYEFGKLVPIMPQDMRNLCNLAQLEIITEKREVLMHVGVPLVANFLNYIVARLPLVRSLCLMRLFITRFTVPAPEKEYSVSVIIPCKNEAGTIEAAVTRTPFLGSFTEILLVDGHSKDETVSLMQEMVHKYPEKNITWFVQSARGKKNAVEEGFARAQGDIIMILDGDITVIPEELPKFYDALASGQGECINGVRLVYPMDREAMPFLNWCVNWIFGFIISYLIGQRVKDTLCGTKVFFKKDLKIIAASKQFFGDVDPFGDFDILCGAAYCNLKILDMPIHYKKRVYGAPGIAFLKSGLLLLSMSFVVFKKLFLRR